MAKSHSITADAGDLEKIGQVLGDFPKEGAKALNTTLKRTADYTKVELGRQIPKIYGISQKEVKAALSPERGRKVSLLSGSEGGYAIAVFGNPLNMIRFRHTPTKPPAISTKSGRRRKYTPRVAIMNGVGKKALQPVLGADGKSKPVFIAPTGTSNSLKVPYIFFHRTGAPSKRNPAKEGIETLHTLSIPQMMLNPAVAEPLLENISQKIAIEVEHQLSYTMEKQFNIKSGGEP